MRGMRAALTCLAAALLAGCAAAPSAQSGPRAERPTYSLGDRWFRTPDGTYELIRIEDDRYVFARGPSHQVHLTKTLGLARAQRGGYFWEFDPPIRLRWPLEVGRSGATQGTWRGHWNPSGVPARYGWRVEAYEDVETPAGLKFKAFRISVSVQLPPQWTQARRREWEFQWWYAPEARQFVKGYGEDVQLLTFNVFHVERPASAPLEITLDQPKDEARVAFGGIWLTGTVTAGGGVARVTVTLNGQEVTTREERESRREVALRLPVPLREGKNVLLVTATDASGNTKQEARTLFYDPRAGRADAEALRTQMLAAREEAAKADAERLAPAVWTGATAKEREAEAALGKEDLAQAQAGYREAQAGYERAARQAGEAARLAREQAETRRLQDEATAARRAAETAEAARRAPTLWGRATRAEQDALDAVARSELGAAQARLYDAAQAFRQAEREATQQGAAAERARLAALKRQLEAAEQVARAAAAARRDAEQAEAGRYAPTLFAPAQEKEKQGQAALDRQDLPTAGARFREAEAGYRRAAQEAQRAAETERRDAALQAERQREAEQLRIQMAQARVQAEQAEARRWVPERWTAAAAQEADGQAALGRREYPGAQQRFREARQGYELAALEATKAAEAALPPLQVALAAPSDQLRVEQDSIGLAGVVSSGKGVRRVLVTLDGVEIRRLDEPAPARSLALNLPVKLREGHNTLVVTATDAAGVIQQEVRTVHYEKLVPLTVDFRYPESGARMTDDASVAAAVVTSSKGVAQVRVTLNGAEVHRQAERTPRRSVDVTAPLTLREGTNTIVLTATEADGTARQEVRAVTYDRPAPVAVPPPPEAKPERWAVVIGIGRYEHPGVPRLRYTVADAEAIYQTLIGPAGFKKERVLLLTDESERKPTLKNIKWALGSFLPRSASKKDTVLIFFAGHGAPEIDLKGEERDGFAKYLVPTDAEPDELYSTALPMDEINTIFARMEAERVVAFLDTCYSGAAGGRTFASKRTRAGQVDDAFLDRLTRSKGRVIVTAARPSEVSVELAELGHGLFTYYLVQGLRGAADSNRDGIVALQELYEYVEREVTRHSRQVGANQHPVLKGELEGVLPLVKVPR